jgi:hypothetical protein
VYMLYVNDSGSSTSPTGKYSVLAGFATQEDQNYWIQQNIDELVNQHTGMTDLEIHGSPLRAGRKEWRRFPKEKREHLFMAVLNYIAANYPQQFILFGVAIRNQGSYVAENLLTQITSRFDTFLERKFEKHQEPARGIAIFDKTRMEQQFQTWSQIYRNIGNEWGETMVNFAETPLFLDSRMSRSIQIADIIAYSIYRKVEYNDDTYFSIIENCFDYD